MISANGHALNGDGHNFVCNSDYPLIDMVPFVPTAPKPGWKDAFPQFTHNVSWVDSDGISHSMTLRSDDLQSLMADLRMLKGMIKAAKQKHTESQPQSDTEQEVEPATKLCTQHNVMMQRRVSKAGGHFYSHRCAGGTWCNGKAKA